MAMTDSPSLLAKVQTPEKGVFAVRCPYTGFAKGQEVVVDLGYGPDLGTVLETEVHTPAARKTAAPCYQLVRAKTDEDARAAAANAAAYVATALLTAGTAVLCRFLGGLSGGSAGTLPILLLNPAVTFLCVINSLTGTGNPQAVLAVFFPAVSQSVLTRHWALLSILLQGILAATLIALSVRLLIPGRAGTPGRGKRRH